MWLPPPPTPTLKGEGSDGEPPGLRGDHAMTEFAPPPREKPWTLVSRGLAAVGLSGKALVIAAPMLWLFVFFLVPLFVVAQIAFSERSRAIPPYLPLLTVDEDGTFQLTLHLSNFIALVQNNLYVVTYFNSIKIAFIATVITLIVAYPMAYFIARAPDRWRNVLLMLVILPFWTSFLLRVYAWMGSSRAMA